ncbi:MAG: ubiquinol-cytochrome c reductase [Candidatus Dojkabacteria bacterium]|jgi:predicted RNA-binding protein with PUA-like domain|nr:MAG: ubiquinol-cytochrome c reductase [Candidatus Dojkabacteria bacterium]
MRYFLFKTDPDCYSIDDLARELKTIWDGVYNFQAINFIKSMKTGDKVLIYHSQKDKAIVGMCSVCSEPFQDLNAPRPSYAVEIMFERKFKTPVFLKEIKSNILFRDFLLVRNPRLSVMAVPDDLVPLLIRD